jgi:hypothetical protein
VLIDGVVIAGVVAAVLESTPVSESCEEEEQ